MALKFKTRGSSEDALAQLMQLAQFSQQQKDRRSRRYQNIYDEYSKESNSFNNRELQDSFNRMENYYNENVSDMSAEDIDIHNMLKEKYTRQMKTNNEFAVDNERMYSFNQDISNFADEYSEADSARSFSWNSMIINPNGTITQQDNIVSLPNPEDYQGGENNEEFQKANDKAIDDLGGLVGYTKKREEYKLYLKNQIQKQIGAYGDYQQKMITDYGASGRLTNFHLNNFAELDQTYAFVVDSMEDDGLFDSEEKAVYQSAIMSKSSKPIEDFITKDKEMKDFKRKQLLTDMKGLKDSGNRYNEHYNNLLASTLLTGDNVSELAQQAGVIPANTQYNPQDTDRSFTFEDIKNRNEDPNLNAYLNALPSLIEGTKQELRIKDDSYMKNDGASFLAGMEQKPWSEGLHDIPRGYIPTYYREQKKDDEAPVLSVSENVKNELVSEDINQMNVTSQVSEIDPKYQKDGQYSSGGKKLEKEINKLNENVEGLANEPIKGNKTNIGSTEFYPGNSIENFFNWPKRSGGLGMGVGFAKTLGIPMNYTVEAIPGLKDITGKDHEYGDFTPEDLLKIEQKYNDDVIEKEKLVKEYKELRDSGVDKNLPEMLALQSKINDIYQRWYAVEEVRSFRGQSTFKRDWNLALEKSGKYSKGATSLYKFMGFLRLRFEEEKQHVKEQSDKVLKIKKNLS